jgi:hypothetical protein
VAEQQNPPQQGTTDKDKDQPEGEQRERRPLGHQVDPRTGQPMEGDQAEQGKDQPKS